MEPKEIRLTQGFVAIVDEEDYAVLSRFKWCASKTRHQVYAVRVGKGPDGNLLRIYMHRQILGVSGDEIGDHKNGNTLDNRRANLRVSTRNGNQQNCVSRRGRSKFKGVSWHQLGNKWQVHIVAYGRHQYLGLFDDEAEAALAYDRAAIKLHGEFARLNFPIEERNAA